MENKKTLFVVGAGASSEAGLPTGQKLKSQIANLLDIEFSEDERRFSGDSDILHALRILAKNESNDRYYLDKLLASSRRIRDAMPQVISIDNFIDIHSEDYEIEVCGKLAIVRSILDAERDSLLFVDKSNIYNKIDFTRLEDTWYASLMKLITENSSKAGLVKRLNSIKIVVFNYDRCIEHFLYSSLQNCYGITPNEAGELVNGMEIYHPYGKVGNLPWQGQNAIDYGSEANSEQLLELAAQIKTFTEGTDPESSEIVAIRKNISQADNIVFLGFAFHPLNMRLIKTEERVFKPLASVAYFCTARGISDTDCEIVKTELEDFIEKDHKDIYLNNKLSCAGLFNEYRRSLSFSRINS